MMYFKNEYHEEMYLSFLQKLNNVDRYYRTFAYIASAIGKKQIGDCLADHEIDFQKLLEHAKVWSTSERAMLEMAYQVYSSGNLFYDKDDYPLFPSIYDIMYSLDDSNTTVVIRALSERYL